MRIYFHMGSYYYSKFWTAFSEFFPRKSDRMSFGFLCLRFGYGFCVVLRGVGKGFRCFLVGWWSRSCGHGASRFRTRCGGLCWGGFIDCDRLLLDCGLEFTCRGISFSVLVWEIFGAPGLHGLRKRPFAVIVWLFCHFCSFRGFSCLCHPQVSSRFSLGMKYILVHIWRLLSKFFSTRMALPVLHSKLPPNYYRTGAPPFHYLTLFTVYLSTSSDVGEGTP